MPSSNAEKYCRKLVACLGAIGLQIKKMGSILNEAEETLSAVEYKGLEVFLFDRGVTKADIKAAKLVAKGVLEETLFFAGVASSKILAVGPDSRKRLLSGEKFEVKQADGSLSPKSWGEMNHSEKNMLLGKKGASIVPGPEQQFTCDKKFVCVYKEAEYNRGMKTLSLKDGGRTGELSVHSLVSFLVRSGSIDEFMEDVKEHVRAMKSGENAKVQDSHVA